VLVEEDADPEDLAGFASVPEALEPDDESALDDESVPDVDESEPAEESPPEELRALPGEEVAERSFLAQPEPLKWTAGVAQALRMVPSLPQFGQKRGPGSLMPWITSTTWWQAEQA
jgi:hypothetical protein